MADVAEPGACQACGRPLPPQQGRGRTRRYCDASCRDAARRERARRARRGSRTVKENLTADSRHAYVDNVDGTSSADDPVALRVAEMAGRLVEEFTRGTSPADAVAAARDLSAAAESALQAAVDRARAAGQSWREIGGVVGTSRQAAFQRFGHPVDPRTGVAMSTEIAAGAAERAVAILTAMTEGRWEEARRDFSGQMSQRLDAKRLADGWARMAGLVGAYEGMGEAFAHRVADHTVVEIPLRFEAGEATGRVIFDEDGKVAGLWLRP